MTNRQGLKNFQLLGILYPNIIEEMKKEISANESLWLVNTARQDNIPEQRETQYIPLRSAINNPNVKKSWDIQESIETKLFDHFPVIKNWVYEYTKSFKVELCRVMIVRLKPYGQVYKHSDFGSYYDLRDRVHLSIQNKGGSLLTSANEVCQMNEGDIFWFNNSLPHQAFNPSKKWRTNLIFDWFPAKFKDV